MKLQPYQLLKFVNLLRFVGLNLLPKPPFKVFCFNPNMKKLVKAEGVKLLDAWIIYPISNSAWVNPVQVVLKKGSMTVVPNGKNELIPTRTVTGWRICINYRRLNDTTQKDHFPLSFIDQMLEWLADHMYYCFLDGMSEYFQIPITLEDR